MESIRSPSGVYQEYLESIWSPSEYMGECHLQRTHSQIISKSKGSDVLEPQYIEQHSEGKCVNVLA